MARQRRSIRQVIDDIAGTAPVGVPSGWLLKRRISRLDRANVLSEVMFDSDPRWFAPYLIMLVLSAGIATLGLSQDSAATVIGAMVIAPLGQPIAALGASLALAWPRESVRMLVATLFGAVLVVAVGFVVGILLPQATPTGQILARTSPDLRDLGVALLAGAAGAYAHTRDELSATLTGVAIAVALVPPLATVGLMLEEHRFVLAEGAAVLFAANLIGIVLSATVVLAVTGYAPLPRLRRAGWRSVVGLGAAALAAAAVVVPLARTYSSVLESAGIQTAVDAQVVSILGGESNIVVDHVSVDGSNVTIEVSGTGTLPPVTTFEQHLRDEVGPDVSVTIIRQ